MDRGAWQATIHGVAKESDTTTKQQQIFSVDFAADAAVCI